MTVLAVAVAGVGALSLLNLVVVIGVVRRLREHSERLANVGGPATGPSDPLVAPVGGRVGSFRATGSGGPVTDQDLADGTRVAVFSPSCLPCQEKLPGFVAHAADRPDDCLIVDQYGAFLGRHSERLKVTVKGEPDWRACAPTTATGPSTCARRSTTRATTPTWWPTGCPVRSRARRSCRSICTTSRRSTAMRSVVT